MSKKNLLDVLAAAAAAEMCSKHEKKEKRNKIAIGVMTAEEQKAYKDMCESIDEYHAAAKALEIADRKSDILRDTFWGMIRSRTGLFDSDINVDPETGEINVYSDEPEAVVEDDQVETVEVPAAPEEEQQNSEA